jgi:hypothetical protein
MGCRYKITSWNTRRTVTVPKCKRIKGLVKRCDEENCDYKRKSI